MIRVTRPSASSSVYQNQPGQGPNVILYLPPGPLFRESGTSCSYPPEDRDLTSKANAYKGDTLITGSPQHTLASMTSATVVTVNYRLGRAPGIPGEPCSNQNSSPRGDQAVSSFAHNLQTGIYKYPTPIHDTLAGFDWVQNTLNPAQLGIFGSHIGGSLALMLALTEAQSVHSVAAMDPVCDWPGLDEHCATEESTSLPMDEYPVIDDDVHGENPAAARKPPKRPRKKKTPRTQSLPDLLPLLAARERFFSTPERYFDAFASPILFLRSAGKDVPRTFPKYVAGPEDPVPILKSTGKTTSAEQQSASGGSLWDRDVYPDLDPGGDDPLDDPAPTTRRRKALSRWPPYGLDYGLSGQAWTGSGHGIRRLEVTLPWVRVFLSQRDVDSGYALRSGARVKDGRSGSATVLARQGEEMVSVMRRACFWGREKGIAERRVTLSRVDGVLGEEVGRWFKDIFEESSDED